MAREGYKMTFSANIGAIYGLEKFLNNPKEVRLIVKKEIQKAIKRNFYDFPKQKWAKWTSATFKIKVSKKLPLVGLGGGQAILQESLRLYIGSVVNPVVKASGNTIYYSLGSIGHDERRALWMQYGTGKFKKSMNRNSIRFDSATPRNPGRGNIKPRPFFGLIDNDANNISFALMAFVLAKAKATAKTIY